RLAMPAAHARNAPPRTATTRRTFVPGDARRARAIAVAAYAVAKRCGSSTKRVRSTITGSGVANASRTSATAAACSRPPIATPATRTRAGSAPAVPVVPDVAVVVVVVVVVVVMAAAVVVEPVVVEPVEVEVVPVPGSATTALENAPAAAKP